MARVTVEQSALTDPRYRILANAIGVDRWSALARMVVVWNHCQETGSYVLLAEIVDALFDDIENFSTSIIAAGLARRQKRGIYICGSRGRIEWLEKSREKAKENGKKGGRPPKPKPEPPPVSEPKPAKNRRGIKKITPPPPAFALAFAPPLAQGKAKKKENSNARARKDEREDKPEGPPMTRKQFTFISDLVRKFDTEVGEEFEVADPEAYAAEFKRRIGHTLEFWQSVVEWFRGQGASGRARA